MDKLSQAPAYSHYREVTRAIIDAIGTDTGYGAITDAYLKMFYGLNHRGMGNLVAANQDNSGITFFTKPDCNLSYDNLTKQNEMMPLAVPDSEPPTIQRAIRATLDPRGAIVNGITSPLVNPNSPFIPLLTNNVISISGWPDMAADIKDSIEGVMREQFSIATGPVKCLGTYDLTVAFRNVQGNPILLLFLMWMLYYSGVRYENMVPHIKNQINLKKDYETRIYHFVLDPSRTYIQLCAVANACIPYTIPIGNAFNFNGGETYIQATDQIPVSFKAQIVEYMNPICFVEFNRLVAQFNPDMTIMERKADGHIVTVGEARGDWVKIPPSMLKRANYYGSPLIHPDTNQLLWYIPKQDMEKLI